MRTSDFNFNLPEDLIAQTPIKNRDESKLLVLDRSSKKTEHKKFKNIIEYFKEGDTLVLNNTRVMPARIYGNRINKEEKIEILLLKEVEDNLWECMVRPGKKARIGHKLEFGDKKMFGKVKDITSTGTRLIEFEYNGDFQKNLDDLGEMPIPPYIQKKLCDQERYQTVFSKNIGSSAAPTAGLHFTKELIRSIEKKGVNICYITLHVGLGTFSPVRVENIEQHKMHSEYYSVSKKTADIINNTKKKGNKVIAVGTTVTRTLESIADNDGFIYPKEGYTDIFIYPGYKFKVVDELITNFHLPESTLLMLVSAFSNKKLILDTYTEAIKNEYRFFSFGDAMYIK